MLPFRRPRSTSPQPHWWKQMWPWPSILNDTSAKKVFQHQLTNSLPASSTICSPSLSPSSMNISLDLSEHSLPCQDLHVNESMSSIQTHKIAVLLSRRPVQCTLSVSKSGLISQSLSFCCRKGVLLAAVNVRPAWMWMDILRKTKGITESCLIMSDQVWSSRLSSRWQQDNSCSIPLILIHLDACGRILMPQCNYSTLPGASVLSLLSAASAW